VVNATGSDTLGLPKVTGARDREQAPQDFGTIELVDARITDACDEVVRALYEHVENGADRSQHIIQHNKYVVYVPEVDIAELMQVSKSPEMLELRRQVEKQSNRRAPRLKFFLSDGSSGKCASSSSSSAVSTLGGHGGRTCREGGDKGQEERTYCDGVDYGGESPCGDGGGQPGEGCSHHSDG